MQTLQRRLVWLTIYSVAMAYLESAVVVYLREIYYPARWNLPANRSAHTHRPTGTPTAELE